MGMDARVRYTKMIIRVNFVSLLKQKPLKKITVKEICEMAEINRTTFYKYYTDAFDLFYKIEEELLLGLQAVMQHSLDDGLHKTLVTILEKIKEDSNLYIPLFSENGDTSFPIKIFRTCFMALAESISQQFPKMNKTQRDWIYAYVMQGAGGILNDWIAGGMKESPSKVADFTEHLISGTLESVTRRV